MTSCELISIALHGGEFVNLDLSLTALGVATLLFTLRVINYAVSTIRLVFIARDMRLLSAATAFLEAFIFVVVMGSVVTDLTNVLNLFAFCMGAAGGSYLGMWLEAKFVVSYSTVTIITNRQGDEIAELLRENNYGVTQTEGRGRNGPVAILRSSTINRDLPTLLDLVLAINPDAFIEIESARSLRRGWIPGGPARRL